MGYAILKVRVEARLSVMTPQCGVRTLSCPLLILCEKELDCTLRRFDCTQNHCDSPVYRTIIPFPWRASDRRALSARRVLYPFTAGLIVTT